MIDNHNFPNQNSSPVIIYSIDELLEKIDEIIACNGKMEFAPKMLLPSTKKEKQHFNEILSLAFRIIIKHSSPDEDQSL